MNKSGIDSWKTATQAVGDYSAFCQAIGQGSKETESTNADVTLATWVIFVYNFLCLGV
jgi:hypothetical protein